MTEEAKKAFASYMREWRKKNPEKEKANRERYWQKKAKEMRDNAGTEQTENVISE